MIVQAGAQDVSTYFSLRLAADGTEATGLTITTLDLQYVRSGAAPAAKVDATALAAVDSAHGDNQAIEVDATDQPGLYRVDWPDAAFAAGVREVILTVKAATVFTEHLRVELSPSVNVGQLGGDAQSATDLKDFADAGYDPATNKVQGVVLVDTLTTYTGNTPQTGDSFARLGAPAGASVSADIAAIESQTDDIAALPTVQDLIDGIWDEPIADHLDAGTTGAALNGAGSAGDPWTTPLPGAYGAGTAGKIVGDNLDTTISSRLAPTVAGRTLDVDTDGAAEADVTKVSGDATAADSLETMLDGTGGNKLSLSQLDINNPAGSAISAVAGGGNFAGIYAQGGGSGAGLSGVGGATAGAGIAALGGTDGTGLSLTGVGAGHGLRARSTGAGHGISAETVSGNEIDGNIAGSLSGSVGSVATDGVSAASLAADAVAEIQSGIATSAQQTLIASNVNTLLNRIGTFTGTGINTILGFLQALARKTASAPSDMGGTFDPTTDSLEAIKDSGLAATLSSSERNAVADAYLDRTDAVETGLTPRGAMRLGAAADAGKVSGAATNTVVARNAVADTKARITAEVDADGNRSAVTTDTT